MSASDWMRQLRITCGLEARRTRPAKWALLSLVSKNTLSLQQGERCKIGFPHDTQLLPFRLQPSRVPAPRPPRNRRPRCHGEYSMKIPVMPHSNGISSPV
jgi:hypothetical protein